MSVKIGDVDLDKKVLVIAEVGGNHGGDFELAKKYVEVVAETGADAVKFQMIKAEKLVTKEAPVVPPVTKYKTQREWFKSLEFTPEQWKELADLAKKHGLIFMSSVFDDESADILNELSPVVKIASGDFTNLPLIRHVVKMGKPVILSTGGATEEEIRKVIKEIPKKSLVLLHCISVYPSDEEDSHLLTIQSLKEEFGVTVGYSDHTPGTLAPLIAVGMGARVIEKHFILDRREEVGDYVLSAEPAEMKAMVEKIRRIEKMLKLRKGPTKAEEKFLPSLRRSLAASVEIPRGTAITADKLVPLRPATGISPLMIDEVVGKKAAKDIRKGDIITEKHLKS
jgi:sialic acid synthase SpsE